MMNTHIRVLPVTLVWISSNCLYMVYHSLTVLIYILLFIAVVGWRLCATLIIFYFASLRIKVIEVNVIG